MASQLFLMFLEMFLLALVHGTVIKRYQSYPPPVCPMSAVCAEIEKVAGYEGQQEAYVNFIMCSCPTGLYCPTSPGPQTLSADLNRWYGLCRPVEELKRCQRGEVAEEIVVGAGNVQAKTYTKILCTCPRHEAGESVSAATQWAGTTTDSSEAKTIYHLMCSEDYMTKRGRFGDGKGRGRKFYFY